VHRRWRVDFLAAVVAVCPIGAALAEDIPLDEPGFTKHVAERVRKAVGSAPVQIKGPLTLSVGKLQANLDRVYAFCKQNATGCPEEVETYVRGVAQVQRDQGVKPTKAAVRVVVRTTQYVQRAQTGLGPKAAPLPMRPLVEGLVMVPALDSPRAIRMFTASDAAKLGLNVNQAHELGLANLRKTLRPLAEVAKPVGRGQIGTLAGDMFHTSRLALVDSWAELAQAQDGVLIVATPATNTVLYIGDDSPAAIDALRTLARNVASRAPNPLSDMLLRWTPDGWQIVR
jgi:ribosomal protein L13E